MKELYFGANKLYNSGAVYIADALLINNTIIKIDLCIFLYKLASNSITDDGAEALGNMLKKNTTLKYLNLETNNIGPKGIAKLSEALQQNSTLEHLNLCIVFNIK